MPNVGSELDDLIKSAPKSVAYILSILLIVVAAALKISKVIAERSAANPPEQAAPKGADRAPEGDPDTPFEAKDGTTRPKITPPPVDAGDGD